MENLTKFATEEQTPNDGALEWLPTEGNDSNAVREVTLVIPVPDDVFHLQRFTYRVEETLQAIILETVGSWSDTHITLKLRRPASQAKILDKLVKMPEVEKAEEKEPAKAGQFNFSKKIKPVSRQEILITLSAQVQLPIIMEQEYQYLDVPKPQPQLVGAMVS